VNHGEAEMVVALAVFLLGQGCKAEEITILATYLGQVQFSWLPISAQEFSGKN
jgi:hypothetical protein